MNVTTPISLDLLNQAIPPIVNAKQDDTYTRFVAISLYANGIAYSVPNGVYAMVRIAKPDGTSAVYDSMDNGDPAVVIDGSTVTVQIAGQALTAPGGAKAEIVLINGAGDRLTTFNFVILIAPSALPDATFVSTDYYNILTAEIATVIGIMDSLGGGTVGQFFSRTENGYEWATIDLATVGITGGTAGQLLSKTANGTEWVDPPEGSRSISATLTAAGWSGSEAPFTQTITVTGITSASNGTTGLADGVNAEQVAAAAAALITKTAQGTNSLTFSAFGEKPAVDIPIQIIVMG